MNTSAQPNPSSKNIQILTPDEHSDRLFMRWRQFRSRLRASQILKIGNDPENIHSRRPAVAIVGTRRPSAYGIRFVREFVPQLKSLGCTLISGGALGIDGEAHAAALRHKIPTQAWLVGPILSPNPSSHWGLFEAIAKSPGGALWVPQNLEPGPGQPTLKRHWIERNQWLIASCDLLVVVEARKPSGTWSSVQASATYGIPTYLLPGPLYSPQSEGINQMISEGCGHPITSVGDLVKTCIVDLKLSSYNGDRTPEYDLGPGGESTDLSLLANGSLEDRLRYFLNNSNGLSLQELGERGTREGWLFEDVMKALSGMLQTGELQVSGDRFERRGL